jgi:hypothetical protein
MVLVTSACITSTGDAPDPVISGVGAPTASGDAALSSEPINPLTCEGVLAAPVDTHSLELQALTESGQAGGQEVDAMCSAVYEPSTSGDPFLAVALIDFTADRSAATHYDLLKAAFAADDSVLSEVDSADGDSMDQFSAFVDRDGIGQTTVLRKTDCVVTISVGPTIDASPWTATDIAAVGESILNRACT